MSNKVAAVTGSNKGIGYAIVKELCKRGVGVVYLCSRDVKRGKDAVANLEKEGLHPTFHQLDITDSKSLKGFADHVKEQHGGLDILINNAGVASNSFESETYEEAERVIDVNYRSMLNVQEILFPILKDNARVINVSSDCGHISNLKNKYWIEKVTRKGITVPDIDEFVNWFLDSVKTGTLKVEDFAEKHLLAYKVSKIAVCALTEYQQRIINRNISINSLHPGFVKTDLTQSIGLLTPDEASKTPVFVALDIDQSVKGKYLWYDGTEKDWTNHKEKLAPTKESFLKAASKAAISLKI